TLASGPGTLDPGSATPADLQDVQGERQRWDQRVAGMLGTIALVVRLLARCRHADGIRSTLAVIAGAAAPHAEQATVPAARVAATALLDADATYWPEVLNRTSNAPDLHACYFRTLPGSGKHPLWCLASRRCNWPNCGHSWLSSGPTSRTLPPSEATTLVGM